MRKRIFTILLLCTTYYAWGQVKMGHGAGGALHPGAHLELANNTAASPGAWQGLRLPHVDFTHTIFTDSTIWGIAGTPADGALVYNNGNRTNGGFKGIGTYVWSNGAWLHIKKSQRCKDPGMTPGDTGCIIFRYRGQEVTYPTVRAKDNNIWLQQNLGAPKVADSVTDAGAYGHYFQWGRWDDGHQLSSSNNGSTSSLTANNPSGIPAGNPDFFSAAPYWWKDGTMTDTWTNALPSATNGKDPCAALGVDWHMPTSIEWQNVILAETITGTSSAWTSNLKLPAAGRRLPSSGMFGQPGTVGHFWTSNGRDPFSGNAFADFARITLTNASVPSTGSDRPNGYSIRCVKN